MTRALALSILDRANNRAGATEADVLAGVVRRAVRAEALGFRRFLAAEHHAVPGIAGSAPTVLAAAIASATENIRVGTAGIMLPDHQPLVVAEQVATLEALFPGRIDIGLGRSTGFTAPIRRSLRQADDAADRFPHDLAELLDLLSGSGGITARPRNDAATPLFVLAGGRSVDVAARYGLGVIVGGPALLQPDTDHHEALGRYRRTFRPSPWLERPHALASVSVAVADTAARARDLALPEAWAQVASRSTGSFGPLQPPAALDPATMTDRERQRLDRALQAVVWGTPGEVAERLAEIARFAGVDEVLLSGGMHDSEAQLRSDRLLAEAVFGTAG